MNDKILCPNCSSPLKQVTRAVVRCEVCDIEFPRIGLLIKHEKNVYEIFTCNYCGCKEGEFHEYGCEMERCPFCGLQLISCECIYEHLGYKIDENAPYSGLPKKVYEKGVSDKEREKWKEILNDKGKISCLFFPNICPTCGKLWPARFMADAWEKVPNPRDLKYQSLCVSCFLKLRSGEDISTKDLCEYCGSLNPTHVIDSERIEMSKEGKFLCAKCHDYIKNILKLKKDMPRKK